MRKSLFVTASAILAGAGFFSACSFGHRKNDSQKSAVMVCRDSKTGKFIPCPPRGPVKNK